MADQKLSELSSATGAGSTDLFYVVQGDTSKKITLTNLALSLSTSMTQRFVLPVYTSTTQATATTGSVIINSALNKIQWYDGATWNTI